MFFHAGLPGVARALGRTAAYAGVALVVGAAALPATSLAQAGPAATVPSRMAKADHVEVSLVSAVSGVGDLKTIPIGLQIKLDGDWKTYWRSPGEAGLPPTLDWSGSRNLADARLTYPAPQRITVLGIQTFGYKHAVVLPIDATPKESGAPLDLALKLDLLICAEQCIPQHFDLALTIPAGAATPDADSQLLAKARAAVPADSRVSGITLERTQEVSDKGAPALEITARSEQVFSTPDVIPELNPEVALGAPRVALSTAGHAATFVVPLLHKLPAGAKLTGRRAIVTITDGDRALEATQTITQGASALEEAPGPSLLAMLGIAFLGGLILNLMPCVLPVLSLKFLSVVSQGGRAPSIVRAGFLATAAGIVVSFLVLAGALIAVKAAGRSIGWGLQFQEPTFIAAMAVLVTIFACHLAGLFDVPLPKFVRDAAANRSTTDKGLAGHFVTGAFATLLATPCSAPFLGTAVGFALAGTPLTMLAIFLALGVGLALPYLMIAAVPQLAARMPKPGRWMLLLKQAMAVPLVGTAVWLLWILTSQIGMTAAIIIAGLLGVITGLLVWRARLPEARRGLVGPAVMILVLATIALPDVIAAQVKKSGAEAGDKIAWTAFDRDQIRGLVAQGKTIFVDVTADWCLTCQANARFVLSNDAIAKRLNDHAIAMRADWTRPNADIGTYLARYGRYGIPFNIIYGPGAPGGIVLPELLTTGNVNDALDKASKMKAAG